MKACHALGEIQPALVRLARRLVGPEAAEDLLQDACLRWVAAGAPLANGPNGALYAYLAKTMDRLLIDRHDRPSSDPLDQMPLPIEVADWMLPMDD